MLTNAKVIEVQNLLRMGLSQREVAAQANVSKGTVALIARGRRLPEPEAEPEVEDEESRELPRVERCPACGVMVELPCVACRTRQYLARRRHLATLGPSRATRQVEVAAGLVYCRWRPAPRRRRRVA